jgi:hypothetical protein
MTYELSRPPSVGLVVSEAFQRLSAYLNRIGTVALGAEFTGLTMTHSGVEGGSELSHPIEVTRLAQPFIEMAHSYEVEHHNNPNPTFHFKARCHTVRPNEFYNPIATEWHTDAALYICADRDPTVFAVGNLDSGPDNTTEPYWILERAARMPLGVKEFTPRPLEMIRADSRHPHRSSYNTGARVQDRILVTLSPLA